MTAIVTPRRAKRKGPADEPGSPYGTQRWKRLRRVIVKRQGGKCLWCQRDISGRGASRVDHIKSAKQRPDLFFDERNLRALCVFCDAKRHQEKGAAGKAKLREEIGIDGFPVDSKGDLWRSSAPDRVPDDQDTGGGGAC